MPTLPREHPTDNLAESEKEIFLELAERFRIAEEAESANRLLAIEDMEFADGQQWPDDLYNMRKVQRRPSLTINHTGTLVRRVVNNLREQRPRIKVHPLKDRTVEDARVAGGIMRHIENRSKAGVAYDTAGECAVRAGWGYIRILGEYADERSFEQELRIKMVRNPFTGYIDPAAEMPDGSDMDWFIFTSKMKRSEFKRKYPDEDIIDFHQGAMGDAQVQWLSKEEIRIAEYYRIKPIKDTLLQLSDGRIMLKSEHGPKAEAFANAGVTIVRERPTQRRQVQWYRVNGVSVVDHRDLPGKWIPVVRVEGNVLDINGQIRRKGMIRDLKDPARMFNFWRTAATEKLALSSKAPWVAAEGQLDGRPEWDDANQKPYSVLKYKLVYDAQGAIVQLPPPQRLPAVEVEAGFTQAAQDAGQDLMMVAGMPHEPQQDAPGTVVSGVALRRRQQISDISHAQYYENQTLAISHVGAICLDLVPHYYSEQRLQRIVDEAGTSEMIQLNQPTQSDEGIQDVKNNMAIGDYDVVMDTGPGYESKRQEASESFIDLLKTPLGEPAVKAGADLILRSFDFAGAQDLADRLMPHNPAGMDKVMQGLPKQAQNIVQSLQQQLQQQGQLIQNLQLEIKYKSSIEDKRQQGETQRAHLAAVTKAHDTETRAQTAETVAHIGAQKSIAVAEIGEAGQLLNTNTEAAHDRAAARELVKAGERAEKTNGAA